MKGKSPPTKWQKNGALPADDKERETCYTGIVPNWDKRKGRLSEQSEGGLFAVQNRNGGREHGEGNTFQLAADSLLVVGGLGLRPALVGAAGAGRDHLGQVFQHHARHLRPGGGHQHHRSGDGGRHCPDRPHGVPKPAGRG